MTQPSKPETPGNTVSEGQDKPRRSSVESPKTSQPTCLRGGFVRLFLKRTEQDNSPEETSISNQNTEDKHGVRGKKRRVLGGNIFRLPCLRPAEGTDTGEPHKGQMESKEQQGHQTVPEEDLKPYSKASFLKKIRGYRLMREREATERLKVIEAERSNSSSFVEEQHEEPLGQSRKDAQPESHDVVIAEKEDKAHKENKLGTTRSNIQDQEGHSELGQEESNTQEQTSQRINIKQLQETVHEKESNGEKEDSNRQDLAGQRIQEDKAAKLRHDSQEQVNQANTEMGQGEHHSHIETAEGLGCEIGKQVKQTLGNPAATNSVTSQEAIIKSVKDLENTLPHLSEDIQTKAGVVTHDLPEQGHTAKMMEKLANDLPEQKSPEEMVTEVVAGLLKQDCDGNNEKEYLTESSEQNSYTRKNGEVKDQESPAEDPVDLRNSVLADDSYKIENKVEEPVGKLPENKSRTEEMGEPEYGLVKKEKQLEDHIREDDNPAENIGEPEFGLVEKEKQVEDHVRKGDNPAENVGQPEFVLVEKEKQLEDHVRKDDNPAENVGKPENLCLDQNSHTQTTEEAGDHFLDQDNHIQKEGKVEEHVLKEDTHIQNVEGKRDCLLGQESHNYKLEEPEASCLGRNRCSENEGEIKVQHDCLEKHEGELRDQVQERCTDNEGETRDRSLGQVPENMEVFPAEGINLQIKEKILITHIIHTMTSEESHTQFPKFQEKELANKVDVILEHQKTGQEAVKDGDNEMMACGNADWTSLQVEVKDMVQWLVDEASDRLTDFTQDPQRTE